MSSKTIISIASLMLSTIAIADMPPAPPSSMDDVIAIMDQYKPDQAATEKLLAEAAAKPPDTSHEQELAVFFHKRSRANEQLGRLTQQIEDLNQALKLALPSALPGPEGLGEVSRILIDLVTAEIWGGNWVRAIELSRRLTNMTGISTRATASILMGDMAQARKAIEESDAKLLQQRSSRDWFYFGNNWQSQNLRVHAMLLEADGNYGEAERKYRRALDLIDEDYQRYASIRGSHWAISIFSRFMHSWAFYEALLSRNLRAQGRVSESSYYLRSALARMLQVFGRNSHYTAGFLAELGWISFEMGNYFEASRIASIAVETLLASGTKPESPVLARTRHLQAVALAAQGDWKQADAIFELSSRSLAADPAQYAVMNGDEPDWGVALLRIGDTPKALAMLERLYRKRLSSGFDANEYFTAQLRGFYAMALAASGQRDKALAEFRVATHALLDDVRRNSGGEAGGFAARQMRLVWILEAYMKLLVDQRDAPALKSAGIDAVAEAFLIADIARGSTVQRALAESAARAIPSDPALAELARREQDTQQRYGTLSDLLNRLILAPPAQQLPKIIADLRRDIETLRLEQSKLKVELDQRFPDYTELISPKPVSLDQARSSLAPGEAMLSIYVGEDRSYVWAVPKTGQIAFAVVPLNTDQVRQQVAHLREALDVGMAELVNFPRFDTAKAHSLYQALLQPVEAGWRDTKNLIIVPHKALGQLPFAVLTSAPSDPPPVSGAGNLFSDYRQVPWLIRRTAITQIPSVGTLLTLRRTPASTSERRAFVGFGDPLFSNKMAAANDAPSTRRRFRNLSIDKVASAPIGVLATAPVPLPTASVANSAGLAQLSRLPETAQEVTGVAKALNADTVGDVFLGKAANEKNVKSGSLENRRVVMFATHGLVPGDLNGLAQPALALSAPEVTGNANEDGLLTMDEVLGLKLNADWVVLSACNTASGDGAGSEAVSGLGKAFFFAGSRTLLVSNWPVETESARLLTTKLFEHQVAHPQATRAESLRATMIHLLDEAVSMDLVDGKPYAYAHPLFWAPFALVGDGGI